MGGIKKDSVDTAIQSFDDWKTKVDEYLQGMPDDVKTVVESSVGYSEALNGYITQVSTTVNTELLAKIQATIDALNAAITGEHGVVTTHEAEKQTVIESTSGLTFETDTE